MTQGLRVLAADIGRTTCRVAIDGRPAVGVANGASLADRDGVAHVLATLTAASAIAGQDALAPPLGAVAVGVTGAAQSPSAAAELADALREVHPAARISVTSDVVTAHIGALAGAPGVVVVAGTGAVALGVAADGRHHLVDGNGPIVGDAGSGTWIARNALEAALRHHDGRPGGSARLAAAATARFGPLERLAGAVQGAASPWRDVAAFVPDVAAAADAGDPVANDLLAAAVRELAATTRAAATVVTATVVTAGDPTTSDTSVSATLVGGLADLVTHVRAPLAVALGRDDGVVPPGATSGPEVRLIAPAGDALDGARRVAQGGPGPHHHLVLELPASAPWAATARATTS